jgi:hypothetical protein
MWWSLSRLHQNWTMSRHWGDAESASLHVPSLVAIDPRQAAVLHFWGVEVRFEVQKWAGQVAVRRQEVVGVASV